MPQVTLQPSGHGFPADTHETVLEAALRHGVCLPYGCRNGACGACKGRVLSGQVSERAFQAHALSESEQREGYTLLCCAEPQGDVTIEVTEVPSTQTIQIKTLPCRVESIARVHDVAILKLKIPAAERLLFRAGQYIDILMKDGKARSFSLANAPHDDALLELHIRHMPGGSFSEYVFTQMKEKEILRFKGPLGSFHLDEDSTRPVILLASGTGFAPVKGIVEHAVHVGNSRPMVLYWGARQRNDLYMYELAEQWARELPWFSFVPVLSEPAAADNWTGRSGLVHQAVLDDFADLSAHEVYACGAPVMVEAAHRAFTGERGLPGEAFHSDAFFLSTDNKAGK
ncbi:CDP-6-deoxy-delta-3,4-glucoseen reductase [Laribacter hongkongensis]|uniref:CDP-6-deoxy-delta-3,4-glucoseen reductase n=1 Tax=Laribacter hongkongensis TaxID=168471 RepID=A0ABD4STU0_9NEIS|nr:CDP-6-deoxy-delta-3,4-glucoseen reductase [Laribacter hongkongensis]MCG9025966.1 CDP-6-deoxy-delta-3,4-glucoseen reductase [Laribacter hongkongensis]MCG9039956.1 CDP-6-deoxy-delta-3,4-glucoseen reductase [Laribacter hongkongensis]MCG9058209.1 CDP-6-deoxy-delta-3,4-glucoseen reductase [Laribacter hongkongensis]MCG9066625.1 CDP-6-deoxy-delta-3,4-glucoseen reductase [Laribacter hongkongensis]MCG9077228.1 CDP-6-deoxy-delta-3,4-glucoseen reductase [Laribacter hongkongensis]